ncbi:hypothetical protein MHU86_11628 [Fragilaria crotonensis]|nr:hypothetical protein MHU86_11628 [Fragilaria crotonensis]
MRLLYGSRLAILLHCIVLSSGYVASANTTSGEAGTCPCDKEVVCGGDDAQARALQTASNQSVVNIAVLFDTTKAFAWVKEIIDFTFTLINNRADGWHDEIFNDGTIINYRIIDTVCNETAAAKAYWDIRNEWGGIVHGVVGCRCSGASMAVGRITSLDQVTQISPSSTSQKLGDKGDFPLFSRLVGPSSSEGEVGAMVAMLRSFGWDRVAIFAMDTQYARDYTTGFEELWKGQHQSDNGEQWRGTVAYSSIITFDAEGNVDAHSVATALGEVPTNDPNRNSRVILLVADVSEAYPILQIAGEQGFQPDTIWVGSQSWVGRMPPEGATFNMSDFPGYLGLIPVRNQDVANPTFLERLNGTRFANGLDVMDKLPDYTAEYLVDSILALVKALSSIPKYPAISRRDGTLVTSKLRNLTFQGVSGNVSFTPEGDRLDPHYTIVNMQVHKGVPKWVEVGSAETTWAEPDNSSICFAVAGCNLEEIPSSSYPVPPQAVELWVVVLITAMMAVLVAVGLKYEQKRRKTLALQSSMSEIEKKIKAMQEIDDEILDIDDKVEAAKRRQATLMQKRAALIEKPDTWSASNEILVEVLPNDPQYWEVCTRLQADMSDAHISKLWRIQNNSLWTYYSFHRDRLAMNGVDHNEKSVWHGTSSVDPSAIYNDRQDGFMMQYSQSGLWGRGIYFAEKSSYSYSYSYQPWLGAAGFLLSSSPRAGAVDEEREMFLTKLLVGKEVLMDRDESPQKAAECKKLIIPPVDPATNLKYNTVTGYSAGSQVWVVYENGRAYPDYLVRYYRGSRDQSRTPFENEGEAIKKPVKKRMKKRQSQEVAPDIEMGNSVECTWEFFDDNSWKPYADHHQVILNSAFQYYTDSNASSSSIVRISAGDWEYEVDFGAMEQRNIQHPSHRQRSVRDGRRMTQGLCDRILLTRADRRRLPSSKLCMRFSQFVDALIPVICNTFALIHYTQHTTLLHWRPLKSGTPSIRLLIHLCRDIQKLHSNL